MNDCVYQSTLGLETATQNLLQLLPHENSSAMNREEIHESPILMNHNNTSKTGQEIQQSIEHE